MNLQILKTKDGSSTLFSDTYNENYHSTSGAVSESLHVFINAGLKALNNKNIRIFEVGFGTGLNAFLTNLEVKKSDIIIDYTAIELYPPENYIIQELSKASPFSSEVSMFLSLHKPIWNQRLEVCDKFYLTKTNDNILNASIGDSFDLVYFDAFSPEVQPELWSEEMFKKMFDAMSKGAALTTYCAKGSVRRTMQKVGFTVERLPGLPPKREMLRAGKR